MRARGQRRPVRTVRAARGVDTPAPVMLPYRASRVNGKMRRFQAFQYEPMGVALIFIDKKGIIRDILVSDINKRPDLERCAVALDKLNQK